MNSYNSNISKLATFVVIKKEIFQKKRKRRMYFISYWLKRRQPV